MIIKTKAGLEKLLNAKIEQALMSDVAPVVVQKAIEHANADVYGVYEPHKYSRRDSLANAENYNSTVGGNTLRVRFVGIANPTISTKEGNTVSKNVDCFLDKIITFGGWRYDFTVEGAAYYKPRPWLENTQEDINENPGEIIRALKKSLEG